MMTILRNSAAQELPVSFIPISIHCGVHIHLQRMTLTKDE